MRILVTKILTEKPHYHYFLRYIIACIHHIGENPMKCLVLILGFLSFIFIESFHVSRHSQTMPRPSFLEVTHLEPEFPRLITARPHLKPDAKQREAIESMSNPSVLV